MEEEKTLTPEEQKNKIEHSGDPHEYLNGKHIKDWEGKELAAARKGSVSNSSGNLTFTETTDNITK